MSDKNANTNATPSILYITSEAAPFAKVGGLADVAGTLPEMVSRQGVEIRVVLPYYKRIKEMIGDQVTLLKWWMIRLGWRTQYCGLLRTVHNGVVFYFIDNEYYFGHDKIYIDALFDIERFCFFQRCVLESLGEPMDFYPKILHCNDWQTAMIPCLMKISPSIEELYSTAKTILTIHNIRYQGIYSSEFVEDLLELPKSCVHENGVLYRGKINFLKAGIVYADSLTTVSESYSQEILTVEYGEGLESVIKENAYKLTGIINGIDYKQFDPASDPSIPVNYRKTDAFVKKQICRTQLREELGLPNDSQIPFIGMVTRLVDQKGIDLLICVLDELMSIPIQLVILGTGDPYYEDFLTDYADRTPQMSVIITFDNLLAHKIYAGADLFMMPSLFEPCGLSQMISMRYGTIPIVRETGGLKDSVIPYNQYTGEGNGFSFRNPNAQELLWVTRMACDIRMNKKMIWKKIMKQAMERDFSWGASAKKTIQLYHRVLGE
jgi:starch synthase